MRRRFLAAAAFAGGLVGWWSTGVAAADGPVRVLAASDLKFVLDELAAIYQRRTGQAVQLGLGSSGQYAQQIRHGLPADIYMSADEAFVFDLAQAGLTRGLGDLYAQGRIAAMVPIASPLSLESGLRGLDWASVARFAIANPQHAPYGRAAQQALERLGLWELARPKLVLGENVAQATQFVATGAAQAGITALSLALAPEVARLARHAVIAADLHAPLRQRMVLLKTARPAAAGFYRFLQTPPARAVFQRYGFATG